MAENVTLEAYERLLQDVVLFREQYEIFDSNVMQAIETFNSDALRAGASFIQQKMGDGFEGYVSHLRQKIYGTAQLLAENLSARYRKWCEVLEQSPKSFNLTFRTYSNSNLSGNRSGSVELRDAKQAYDACNYVRSHLTSSYSILTQAFARLNSAVNGAREHIVVQDISRVDGWLKTIGDGVRQAETPYKVTIKTLEVLVAKLGPMLKS